FKASKTQLPFTIESNGVVIETFKQAEKGSDRILRLVENKGRQSSALLTFAKPVSFQETDLMEWKDKEKQKVEGEIELDFKPFEIRTFRLA
ncbi:MAG: glycosyl hydrolase-related protein, partial [Candidatus Sumerlaeota bacterium]